MTVSGLLAWLVARSAGPFSELATKALVLVLVSAPACLFVLLSSAWPTLPKSAALISRLRRLRCFFAGEEAAVAPNFPEVSARIRAWLEEFVTRNGPYGV